MEKILKILERNFKMNNNDIKVENKMIIKGNENNYYGIERTFCVGRLNIGTLLDLPEGEERWGRREPGKLVIDYDFGKPYHTDSGYRINNVRLNRWDFEEIVKNIIDDVMISGTREDILQSVQNKLRTEYKVSVLFTTYTKAAGYMDRVGVKLSKVGEERFKDEDVTTNISDIVPYLSEEEFNVRAEIDQPDVRTNSKTYNGNKAVEYLVNKVIKDKYTYCTKSGKNIVPDEYIKDGEAGIKAYQADKRSKNKNNSIEKQMIKKLKQEKIDSASKIFYNTMNTMLGQGRDWQQVFLTVDGMWNTSRKLKTIKTNIINVSDNELVMMSEDEIKTRCKNYWKNILNEAIDNIDQII